jgi:hypothetical protein
MKAKDPAAVALGKRGGKAKNAKLSAKDRKAMMAEVRSFKNWPQNVTRSIVR